MENERSPTIPLMALPLELFLLVWDLLPSYARVSLVLTCRSLYDTYGNHALAQINENTPNARSQRASLLRQLRKDSSDPSSHLCAICMKLHRIPYIPPRPGFFGLKPKDLPCRSPFLKARQDVHTRLSDPQDRGLSYYIGKRDDSSVCLNYMIKIDVSLQGLYTSSQYQWFTPDQPNMTIERKDSLEDILSFCRNINVEFCPHAWLGSDSVPGDGSLDDQLLELALSNNNSKPVSSHNLVYHHGLHCHHTPSEYRCEICHVNIKFWCCSAHHLSMEVVQHLEPEKLPWGEWERPARTDFATVPPDKYRFRKELDDNIQTPGRPIRWMRRLLGRV